MREIVMVGGSSRIPLVARLLRECYQLEPLMIDPDLCVAVGAAVKAASAAVRSNHLLLDRPAQVTALLTIDLSGQVIVDELDGVVVWLVSGDGTKRPHAVGIAEINIPQVVLPSWDRLLERYEEVRGVGGQAHGGQPGGPHTAHY